MDVVVVAVAVVAAGPAHVDGDPSSRQWKPDRGWERERARVSIRSFY